MLLRFLRKLFCGQAAQPEVPMVTVVYKARIVAADGTADLELEAERQFFVPREGDAVAVTTCVSKPDNNEVQAVVQEVVYDPVLEVATVFAETDLDLREGWGIDCIVQGALQDGWVIYGDVEYHGCCKGLCPCDVKGDSEPLCDENCDKPECQDGCCEQK